MEDFVSYSIFPVASEANLVDLRSKCFEIVGKYVENFMWHRQPFSLNVNDKCLFGKVNIGDSVEDEWYIISLLFRLSQDLEVVVQVNDQDGEVLLIESADFLPKWAQEPELSENRVFIYKNKVHLIPVAQSPADLTPLPVGTPNVCDAINTVIKFSHITQANDQVQSAISARLKSYPENWTELSHYTHVIVPQNLSRILQKKPQLISEAVQLFYNRDPIDLKQCRLAKNFNPKQQKLVKTGLRMTKCLYAMLCKQKFIPDTKVGWPNVNGHCDEKALSLGAKLACGFEILANAKSHQEDVKEAFIQSLINKGYFQGELRGSKKFNELLAKAEGHLETVDEVKTPSMELKALLEAQDKDLGFDNDETEVPSDDDSWLDLKPETFDDYLTKHFNLKAESTKSKDEIPKEVTSFLKTMSDFKGIEEAKKKGENIDFKPDEFENAFKKVLGLTSDNDSDMSDSDIEDLDFDGAEMNEYFAQMSQELKGTNVTKEEDEDWDKPLDVDAKVLSNLLESYRGQGGVPGPASTLLQPLGFDLND